MTEPLDPNLQKQLADLLKKLIATAGDASTFAAQQLPPLVHEKIVLGRITYSVECAVFGLAFGVFTLLAVKNYDDGDGDEIATGLCTLAAVISLIVLVFAFEGTAQVWFAPRVYILEWLTGLVHG